MCGINGYVTSNDSVKISGLLDKMNEKILHRGPDQDGFFEFQNKGVNIGMAMRRLSIIDLSTGKQPIYNYDKSIVIVFNGEIYNYNLLKSEMEKEGVKFITSSDTEVILKLYECYGEGSFGKLDGMFAFSIYDKNRNKVFIARDFFGEKPLYYSNNSDNQLYWASELKSLLAISKNDFTISKIGLNLFFQLTYIPAPYTIYNEVKKLEANHYLEYDCETLKLAIREIAQSFQKYEPMSKNEIIKTTHDLVFDSVKSRSISDVSLGTFLSGGVDSSIISLCLANQSKNKIDTFSIGFDKKSFDETNKSRAVAKLINSNHHEFIISEKDLTANFSNIILNFDEPFADSSALASYVVANKTSQYVKVALTGDGGDEVFGGYNKYYMGKLNQKYTSFVPEKIHSYISGLLQNFLLTKEDNRGKRFKLARLLKAINYDGDFYYKIISLGFQQDEVASILKVDYVQENPLSTYKRIIGNSDKSLNDFREIDRILSLEGDMLVKVDRTSMLTSLECRAPFLNKQIWNFTKQIPEDYLLNGWNKKYILKESFKNYFPDNFLDKSKKGFGVPVGDWLRSDLKNELLSFVDKNLIEKQGIFIYDTIRKIVLDHIQGKVDNTFRVWTFFCFQKWYVNGK